jgi:TolB-like protein/Tfp pilus assembly protein PilF
MFAPEKSVALPGFFEEVRRRKVYRVAAAYVVAAGGIIQLASAAFPAWELPDSILRVLIVCLLMGFPVALMLAWAFDITADGIRVTPDGTSKSHARLNMILLVVAGLILSAGAGFFLLPRVAAHKIDRSIAVLPFQNLSDDKENAYFADGVQDDVLTNLSKIGDLKVISRTSVMPYRDMQSNARDIGKALGVATILEGSVRRIGSRVRVNVQLINVANDQHIWAEDYDRELTDVFAIQSDLAQKIAGELRAKLSPTEKAQIEQKPTENSEAYLAFVEGHDLLTRPDRLRADTEKAEQLFEKATRLDPNFSKAFAALAWVQDWMYHTFDPTPARKAKAHATAEEALRLEPDLPEGHLALGFYHYYCERNYQWALEEFAIAKKSLPNSADVYLAIGAIQRRQGKWAESTANMEKAASLSPRDAFLLMNLADNYRAVDDFEKADRVFDRAIEAAPNSVSARTGKAMLAADLKGDLSEIDKQLVHIPPGAAADSEGMVGRAYLLTLQRKFHDAMAVLKQLPGDGSDEKSKEYLEGALYTFVNDKGQARSSFQRARAILEKAIQQGSNDAMHHMTLALVLSGLGEKDAAIAEGKLAVALLPESQDALDGPKMTLGLAQIYAWTGENDSAFELLERSLTTPAGVTVSSLKLNPVWDPLRADARFQALIDVAENPEVKLSMNCKQPAIH